MTQLWTHISILGGTRREGVVGGTVGSSTYCMKLLYQAVEMALIELEL